MFEIELLAQAEDELSEAFDWYEEKQPGLGNKFYHEVNHYLNLIENRPYHFPVRYTEELRTAALIKFPYLIIYWVDDLNKIVFVASVFHTSKKPLY